MSKPQGRNRRPKNTVTTKSGNSIKVNRSMADRNKARKAARAADKAAYLSTLPKERWKRILYRMHPQRMAQYWFSREGGIMALKIIGASIVVCFFLTIGLFAYFRKDLPKIKNLSGDLGGNITYYDRTGQVVLFNDYNSVKRIPVDENDISPYMKKATVAIEDKDFYKHGAFDVRGIMRAAYRDATGSSGATQGGSTITQQLVKLNENWTDNRTVTRKVKELILAVELEREYSKNDILTGYLNIAPYGGQEYGVESAARDYFQTSAKNLTLAQASMLAAIPQSPGYYSPYGSPKFNPAVSADYFNSDALIGRQHYILDQMVKQGYISQDQASEAKNVDILAQIHPQEDKYKGIRAPYFVLAAKQELEQTYGSTTVQRGGWKVITTLNMDLQNKAEELVASNRANALRSGADEEAIVAEDVQTGQIVSLVGGTDFNDPDHGKINYAAGVKIPPGSSFKPYDYVTLINNNNNVGAGSVLYDAKTKINDYYEGDCTFRPTLTHPCPPGTTPNLYDYDNRFPGPLTLRYALGGSRNVPAVKAMLEAVPNDKSQGRTDSINKVLDTASAMMDNKYLQSKSTRTYNCYRDVGLTKTNQCGPAAAIGDGAYLHLDDHVNGLSTLARLGKAIPRTYILKITDAGDKTVYQWKQPQAKQVIKEDAAYILDDMASDPKASYLNGSCTDTSCFSAYNGKFHRYKGWHFAIKTGTTNDGYDGLMTSWSSKYAVVTWVGNHTRQVTLHNFMENLTEPMARPWMEYAHQNLKPVSWTPPKTIKTAPAFIVRSHVGLGSSEPSPTNDLYPGWYIGGGANTAKNSSQVIDKVSNKVATSCTPALAKSYAANSNAATWNIDIYQGGRANIGNNPASNKASNSSSATDDVHNCNDSPPTITLTAPDTCNQSCVITATVSQGTHLLTDPQYAQFPGTVTFTLNGQTIQTSPVSDSPSTVSFTYKPSSSGSGTLTATVTDSVLYSGTASQTLNFTAASQVTLAVSSTGHTLHLAWSGTTGATTGYVNGNPIGSCSNVAGSFCDITVASNGNYVVRVQDNDGNKSDDKTVTVGP
ncbi:MAG: transglycosylase domain-containing protein [Candidatus Saccharimonadales bacterium]